MEDNGVIEMASDEVRGIVSDLQSISPEVRAGIAKVTLDDLFKDRPHVLSELKSKSVVTLRETGSNEDTVLGAHVDSAGHVIAVAAALPRNPGKSDDYLRQVADLSDQNTDRAQLIDLCHMVASREGLANNSVQKAAALIAVDGSFKVRSVKGKRGVKPDKVMEELAVVLQFFVENVNARGEDSVITGDRGIQAFMSQGVRLCLIEGDHIGRTQWAKVAIPALKGTKYSLPMNLHTFSVRNVEIPDDLLGTGVELIYWKPPASFINSLRNPKDKNVKKYLDKMMDSKIRNQLIKDGKVLLDPALLFHVKNRGTATSFHGQSMIEPALNEIAYKRALQALDIVTIENLINRLVIIKLGSDDPNSLYHSQEVTNGRMTLLASMMRRIGPSSTLLWPGPDLDIVEVGAHNKILETDQRYAQVEARIRAALGVPAALLSGDASGGKTAGWTAVVGLAAQLSELANQYKQLMRTLGERIAEENGFEEVDLVWEFHQDLLANKEVNSAIALKAYLAGLISNETALEEMGKSFEAEEIRMAYELEKGYRDRAFGPPPAAEKAKQIGNQGGRPSLTEDPSQTDSRRNRDSNNPESPN